MCTSVLDSCCCSELELIIATACVRHWVCRTVGVVTLGVRLLVDHIDKIYLCMAILIVVCAVMLFLRICAL